MFRMAAVYMALKEVFPEQALEILGAGVEREGRRIAKMLSRALHIPGMDYIQKWQDAGYAFTYKVFRNVGHGGLIAEHTEQFIEEVKAVHAASPEREKR